LRIWTFPKKADALKKEQIYEEKMAAMNEEFKKIRAQRHDFLKHVNTINHLLWKNENHELKEYFQNLLSEYHAANMSIKGEDGHIAATLLQSFQKGTNAGVKVTYDLDVPMSRLPLKPVDQIKLIGNLLDNAIEAAEEYLQSGEEDWKPEVSVKTEIYSGIFILEIRNHAHFYNPKILDSLFQTFEVSTKDPSQHEGIGTYIISNLVKNYHGKLTYSYKKPILSIKIKIPIIIGNHKNDMVID